MRSGVLWIDIHGLCEIMLGLGASLACVVPKPPQPREQRILRLNLSCVRGKCDDAPYKPVAWIPERDARPIAASRQLDADRVAHPLSVVIVPELIAQAPRLDAHDGINDGVERIGAPKDFQRDAVAFDPLSASGECLVDDIFQEPLPALRLDEWATREDAVKLLADGPAVPFTSAIE